MSNSSFSTVKNTTVNKTTVQKPELANESGYDYITHSAAGTVTSAEWQAALDGRLLLTTSGAFHMTLGADTAVNAKDLQIMLGVPRLDDNAILRIVATSSPPTGADILLRNSTQGTTNTNTNVIVNVAGTDAPSANIAQITALTSRNVGGEAVVLVTNANDTSGSEIIRFTILQQIGFSVA